MDATMLIQHRKLPGKERHKLCFTGNTAPLYIHMKGGVFHVDTRYTLPEMWSWIKTEFVAMRYNVLSTLPEVERCEYSLQDLYMPRVVARCGSGRSPILRLKFDKSVRDLKIHGEFRKIVMIDPDDVLDDFREARKSLVA